MSYQSETKQCQNCKQSFTIEPEDFEFYNKIHVPPPTFCPECRMVRRLNFKVEAILYSNNCDLCGKKSVSIYHKDSHIQHIAKNVGGATTGMQWIMELNIIGKSLF